MPRKKQKALEIKITPSFKGLGMGALLIGFAVLLLRITEPEPLPPIQDVNGIRIEAAFTPDHSPESAIIQKLQQAKREILVMAYSFTSKPIASALIDAHQRGVKVFVLADKSQISAKNSQTNVLKEHGIPVLYDVKPAIAHNKVILIDERVAITGSYNFTHAAEHRNTENLLFIQSQSLAKQYKNYWISRKGLSVEKSL